MKNGVIVESMMISRTESKPAFSIGRGFRYPQVKQKYRLLFSPKRVRKPGPKGPTKELIDAVVEMKRRHQTWGYKRIAQQIALAFGVAIDKDVVRPGSSPFISIRKPDRAVRPGLPLWVTLK